MSLPSLTIGEIRQPRQWTLALPRVHGLFPLLVAAIMLLLIAAESLLLSNQYPHIQLTPASKEAAYLLHGFHRPEQDARGTYRWTSGHASMHFYQFGQGDTLVFGLKLGPAPPHNAPATFTLGYGDEPARTFHTDGQPRTYRMLVPPAALQQHNLQVHLSSSTTSVPPDTRQVGLRFEGASLTFIGSSIVLPAPLFVLVQVLLLMTATLLLHRVQMPSLLTTLTILLLALLMLLLYHQQMLLAHIALLRLLIAAGFLTLLTYVILPQLERHMRWLAPPALLRTLWGIALFACMIRLVGSLYPNFDAYDLSLNVGRLLKTIGGTLVVTNNSIEFRNGVTVYPPGPYLLLLPGMIARIPPDLLVEGGIAIIDGAGALLIAALALMLGSSQRTALFSALLYAAVPIHLTALWWGLSAQIFGQMLMPPLMIALLLALNPAPDHLPSALRLPPAVVQRRAWIAVVLLLSMSLLSHIGVAILAVAWLGLAWLIVRVQRTVPLATWWSLTVKLALSCLLGVALIYSTVAVMMVEQAFAVSNKVVTSDYVPAYWLIYHGFKISFHVLGFWLLVPGLWLLWRRRLPVGGSELIAAWLGTVAVFWAIEMMTALQVRYIYFLTPLACIAIGYLLDRLAVRGQVARSLAWVVLVLLLFVGARYWYIGTFTGEMMSVSPLLR
jgi:hypothetical protein